jgi:phosphohistidine phosphatase SixA
MKTLFLIRHAKSSWENSTLPDKDRPLNDRGKWEAPKMGKRLAKRAVKPELIVSSPAVRALATAKIIARKLDYELKEIVVDDRLYPGDADKLLTVIHRLDNELKRVMHGQASGSPSSQKLRSTIQGNRKATQHVASGESGFNSTNDRRSRFAVAKSKTGPTRLLWGDKGPH